MGISARNTIFRGTLKSARRSRQKSRSSLSVAAMPSRSTMAAATSSPSFACGMREGQALRDRRVIQQHAVDLQRADLLAAAVDQFLQPAGQAQVAVVVDRALVAGAEPAVGEGLGVGLGIVFVARGDVAAADDDLAERRRAAGCAPSSSMMATSGPAAMPTEPGLRGCGGSGLDAIWCAASVMP